MHAMRVVEADNNGDPSYRAECSCGWKGVWRLIRSNAEASAKLHVATRVK